MIVIRKVSVSLSGYLATEARPYLNYKGALEKFLEASTQILEDGINSPPGREAPGNLTGKLPDLERAGFPVLGIGNKRGRSTVNYPVEKCDMNLHWVFVILRSTRNRDAQKHYRSEEPGSIPQGHHRRTTAGGFACSPGDRDWGVTGYLDRRRVEPDARRSSPGRRGGEGEPFCEGRSEP